MLDLIAFMEPGNISTRAAVWQSFRRTKQKEKQADDISAFTKRWLVFALTKVRREGESNSCPQVHPIDRISSWLNSVLTQMKRGETRLTIVFFASFSQRFTLWLPLNLATADFVSSLSYSGYFLLADNQRFPPSPPHLSPPPLSLNCITVFLTLYQVNVYIRHLWTD